MKIFNYLISLLCCRKYVEYNNIQIDDACDSTIGEEPHV
jgi:hypothetical protein